MIIKPFLNGSFIQCPIQTYTQDLTSHTRPDRHVPYPLISLCNMKSPQWTVMQSGKEEDKLSLSLSPTTSLTTSIEFITSHSVATNQHSHCAVQKHQMM